MFIPTLDQIQPALDQYGTPLYVGDQKTIQSQCQKMIQAFERFDTKLFYAIKANFNPSVIKTIKDAGIYGIDAVSVGEVQLALKLGYTNEQIIYTPSNPSNSDLQFIGEQGILPNLGSLSELERFGQLFPGYKVSVRICPEIGQGEFDKITTGQMTTKFGIVMNDVSDIQAIVKQYNLQLVGIHSHIGSGFYTADEFTQSVRAVCDVAKNFSNLEFLDFGGGFGVSYHPDKPEVDLSDFANAIEPIIRDFENHNGRPIQIRLEPGKFLVSASTVLCAQVTTIKQKDDQTFIGLDMGFGQYIRPAMYGAYQHFVNLSNPDGDQQNVQIAGNVCETCDIFNEGIEIAQPREGDILAMLVAGGYGSAMGSNYNLGLLPAEVMLCENGEIKLTRRRQSIDQALDNFVLWRVLTDYYRKNPALITSLASRFLIPRDSR